MGTQNLPQVPAARNVLSVLRNVEGQAGPAGATAIARDVDLAGFPLAQLVERTKRTAHLAVMHGREVIYVIEERAKRQTDLVTNPVFACRPT